MPYAKAVRIVEAAGMSIEDGLAFTVAGGLLTNGEGAPERIQQMNGWAVEDAAAAISTGN